MITMAKKRVYDDDDGRTVFDMSGVERPGLITPKAPSGGEKAAQEPSDDEGNSRPWEAASADLTPAERRWCILGAVKAALLIALAFIIGLGIVITIMYFAL
jgi:hypothetical protein